jgi:hypothetical protein
LWKQLKAEDELSLARRVLQHMREKPHCVIGGIPNVAATKKQLCEQEALLTSKDPELNAAYMV